MDSFRRSSFSFRLSKSKICLALLCLCLRGEAKDSIDHASVAFYAVHIPTGKVLLSENSQKSLIPCSCLKIVTTAAALHILGPDTCFQTHLAYDGAIQDGVLQGNLTIVGGGDPCLGSDRVSPSLPWKKQIDAWTSAIQALGITHIEGKVIGDASSWEKALAIPSWAWEDLGNYYGAGASALSFHENAYSLFFRPSFRVGEEAKIIKVEPAISRLVLNNEVTTGKEGSGDQAWVFGSEFSFTQYVRGTVPAGVLEFVIRGAIPDPALACSDLLKSSLEEKGIAVLDLPKPLLEKKIFHTTNSPPLKEIVHVTNQQSMNLHAEHLLKKMGGGSSEAGLQVVKKFLKESGIPLSGFYMVDGSGLSRKNLMTVEQFVSLLVFMKKSEFFPVFLGSFPKRTEVIRAKSGYMTGHTGYVGYANDIAFAILINQCMDSQGIKEKIDDFFSIISKK